jgi:predicted DNA-binding protein YlxM (UPF0122 family)
MFRKRTKEIVAIAQESKVTLKIWHDRNMNLIIKELSVKGDSIDEVIDRTREMLDEFNTLKMDMKVGV